MSMMSGVSDFEKSPLFENLYRGNRPMTVNCNSNNIGQEYICPKVGSGYLEASPQSPWLLSVNRGRSNCHGPTQSLSQHCGCSSTTYGTAYMSGGGAGASNQPIGSHHISQNQHPRNASRHYEAGTVDVPSYYPDVTQERIGGRPVYERHDKNTPPASLEIHRINLPDRQFGCRQPFWKPSCI